MANQILLNLVRAARVGVCLPGSLYDDVVDADAILRITAAGGVLWPVTDTVVAAAAALARAACAKGASIEEAAGLLLAAATQSTRSAVLGSPTLYDLWGTADATLATGLIADFRADNGAAPSGSTWVDLSTSGNATQSIAANRPTFSATAAGGRFPGVTFDGTNDWLQLPASQEGAKTIGIALQFNSLPAESSIASIIRLLHGTTRTEIVRANASGYKKLSCLFDFAVAGATAVGVDLPFDLLPHTIIIVYTGGTNTAITSYSIYVDGNFWLAGTSNTINASASSIGSIGGRGNSTPVFENSPAPATYYRARIYNRALATSEIRKLHRYLSNGFTLTPSHKKRAVCQGDSLTFGQGVTSAQAWPAVLRTEVGEANIDVLNLGIGGQTVDTIVQNFGSTVAPLFDLYADNTYVIWAGTNDLAAAATAADTAGRIEAACRLARAAGFQRVVVGNTIARGDVANATILALNALIERGWRDYADRRVDMYTFFPSFTDTGKFNGDQTHLTVFGEALAKDQFRPAVYP